MEQFVCLLDYERYALKHLKPSVRDYYRGGAGDEYTLNLNREAFKKYRIRPRVLRDVSKRDISTTVLGEKIAMPVGVSPTAMQRMAHPEGECANARATGAAGTVFMLSTLSTSSIEEVSQAAPNTIKWYQLYVYTDRNITLNLVQRAENAGFKALVLTVDAPLFGDRRADIRNKFTLPSHLRFDY
ncbi:peroxisomal (S)-2-hydroxy-acid oxidase GLO3-like [Orussus abietinus]|uniref:peroxisomal (S)-2-hydroxy-acid oxidase GLO3-like n=1 Tax=Orussus abietinus TaxID=222816 RepID=UPI000C715CA3|nr:peroxisomal (S)-2-hydroxy-acid oxidase GLO3-like [Orussus abietinus]XP_023289080.1 peroxisomal (S)-2-hydroxy-acid oxidase GLO3-like [Orussus abietinus]